MDHLKSLIVLLCVFMKGLPTTKGAGFSVTPETAVQAEGVNATFYCAHPQASATGWNINGTSVNRDHPSNVFVGTRNGGSLHYLTILATPIYNGTIVQCFAFTVNNDFVETPPVMLFVQGVLNSIMNIVKIPAVAALIITWEPPFSMNLTSTEPDIEYCIDIFNVTNNQQLTRDLLISDYGVLDSRYIYTNDHPDPTDLFEFRITPRSNVQGARNGTPSEYFMAYFHVRPSICVESVMVDVDEENISLQVDHPNWADEVTITVSMWTVDDPRYRINCDCLVTSSFLTTTNNCSTCSRFILRNRVYMARVGCKNEIGMNESNNIMISTHGILNATFTLDDSGSLNFSCLFKAGSTSSGCLAISKGFGTDNLPLFTYKIAHRISDMALSTLQGLPLGENELQIYEIERSGLPGKYTAITANVIVSSQPQPQEGVDSNSENLNGAFRNIIVYTNAGQMCVSYSLLPHYKGCTIVYVPCTTAATPWNAISVQYTNGQEQSVCYDVDSGCYSVAEFGVSKNGLLDSTPAKAQIINVQLKDAHALNESIQVKEQIFGKDTILYISITLGVLLLVCITIIILITIVCLCRVYCIRGRRSNSLLSVDKPEAVQSEYETIIDLQKCEAYQTASAARSGQV